MTIREEMRRRAGFTLIELLVAAALTAALAAVLLAVSVEVLGLWGRSGGALGAAGEASRILDQMALDLEAAVLRPDAGAWLVATVQRDQTGVGDSAMTDADWTGLVKPAGTPSLKLGPEVDGGDAPRFGQAGVWLRFFTTEPDANDSANNRSLPRAVSYQIVRRRTGSGHAYQLFRSQVRPGGANSTFTAGFDLFAAAYATGNASEQHPGNIRRPNTKFLLGNHVIDFGLRIAVRTSDEALAFRFPFASDVVQSFVATAGNSPVPGYEASPVERGWPVRIDLMVRVLSDEGARLITNLESGRMTVPTNQSFASVWWNLAETHSRVFVRTVTLHAPVP